MKIMTKVYPARVLSIPSVVINLFEFKQKVLIANEKLLDNGWTLKLGDNFAVENAYKIITLPKDQEKTPHIFVVNTTKEDQKALFKDIQLAFKLAKKVK